MKNVMYFLTGFLAVVLITLALYGTRPPADYQTYKPMRSNSVRMIQELDANR